MPIGKFTAVKPLHNHEFAKLRLKRHNSGKFYSWPTANTIMAANS